MNFYFNLTAKDIQRILAKNGYICMTLRKFLYKCGWSRIEVNYFSSNKKITGHGICWKMDENFDDVKNRFLSLYKTSDTAEDMWYFWAMYDEFLLKHSQQVIIKQLIRKEIYKII